MNPVDMDDPKQRQLFRELLAEAIDAWLDKQFTRLGKWTMGGIASIVLAIVAYLFLSIKGLKV